jgi:hypothetical protein
MHDASFFKALPLFCCDEKGARNIYALLEDFSAWFRERCLPAVKRVCIKRQVATNSIPEITNTANLSISNIAEKRRLKFLFCSCLFSALFSRGTFQLLLMQLLRSLINKTLHIASAAH